VPQVRPGRLGLLPISSLTGHLTVPAAVFCLERLRQRFVAGTRQAQRPAGVSGQLRGQADACQWPCLQEPLRRLAAGPGDLLSLLLGLDAFGGDAHAQHVGEIRDCCHD